MARQVKTVGNYFLVIDLVSGKEEVRIPLNDITFKYQGGRILLFDKSGKQVGNVVGYTLSELVDATETAFANIDALTLYLSENTSYEKADSSILKTVEKVLVTRALTVSDSGKTFILSGAVGAPITLPALTSGLAFKFKVGLAFATTNWTIVAPTSVVQGNALVAGAHVASIDQKIINFVATAESVGDFVEVECDGTNWYVSGSAVTLGAITFTTV